MSFYLIIKSVAIRVEATSLQVLDANSDPTNQTINSKSDRIRNTRINYSERIWFWFQGRIRIQL